MIRIVLFVIAFAVGAVVVAGAARATSPLGWWSSDHAEAVVMDSDWSFQQGVDDVNCGGWGAARVSTVEGGASYRRFTCTAYAEVDEQLCLPGECQSESLTWMCTYRLRIQTTGADSFLIVTLRSSC